jgi:outer membrane immunogenic protein
MKRLVIAALAFGAMAAGPAAAADLSVPPLTPLKTPPSLYSWGGCYVGVQAGGGFMHDSYIDNSSDPIFHGGGAIAGGQLGCNYQVRELVVGIEAEGWWSGLSNKSTDETSQSAVFPGGTETLTTTDNFQTQNRWDATVALRAGWAFDRILLYGKAGAAFGNFKFTRTNNFMDTNGFGIAGNNSFANYSEAGNQTLVGMVLGLGVEWAFFDNWIARVEADYINFPRTDVSFTFSGTCSACGYSSRSGTFKNSEYANEKLLKVGLSYKFY